MGSLLEAARSAAVNQCGVVASPHAAELRRLIGVILGNDTQAERDWTLSVALRDPENALISFRTLVEQRKLGSL